VHELGIAADVCRAVAKQAGGRRVKSFIVEVGALAGVSIDALDFCVREVARDMGLGEPEVKIVLVPAEMKCACGVEYAAEDVLDPCPSCGGYQRQIVSGMDISIRDITLEGDGLE